MQLSKSLVFYAVSSALLSGFLVLPAFAATHSDSLKESVQSIERIQVTGTVMQTPVELTEDTKIPRQPLPSHDGGDYLAGITGFSLVRKGGASSDPLFRGLAGSRITILSDGAPVLGGCESRMDPPTAYISPQSYDRIQIVKGPQSVSAGPPAAAATVNFERKDPDFSEQKLQGFLSLVGGSYGRAETNLELQTGNDAGYARINYTFARSDDYKDANKQKIHSQYERWNSQLTLGYHLTDQQSLSLTMGTGDGESAYADRAMDGTSFYRENLALKWKYSDVTPWLAQLQARAYYAYIDHIMDNYKLRTLPHQDEHDEHGHHEDDHGHGHGHGHGSAPSAHNPERYTRGFAASGMMEFGFTQVEIGVDASYNTHRDRMSMDVTQHTLKEFPYVMDAKIDQIGVFLEAQSEFKPQHTFYYGYRADQWKATDFREHLDMMGHQVNPTAGEQRKETLHSGFVRYEIQQQQGTYFVGLGQAKRFPDYWEMIARGRRSEDSASAFHIAPETVKQLDMGYMHSGTWSAEKEYQLSINTFMNHIDDYILIEQDDEYEYSRNVDTKSYGLELDTELAMTEAAHVSASLSYVRATNKTDNRPLAQQPPLQARFGLHYEFEHWDVGAQVRLAKAQHRVALGQGTIAGLDTSATPGYAITSIHASWHANDKLQLHFGIDNLFNTYYVEHLSRNAAAIGGYPIQHKIPEPGRNFWAYLSYRL